MRRTRGPAASNGSGGRTSSAQARCGASGPDSASASETPVSRRSPRIVASAAAAPASTALRATGRQDRQRTVRRGERREIAVEPRRVPAPGRPVERVGARARPPRTAAASSRRGCAGSRGRGAPSWRSRSRGSRPPPSRSTASRVLRRRPVVVLLARPPPPASDAPRPSSAGGRPAARSAPRHRGRRASAHTRRRGRAPGRARRRASPPRSPRVCPGTSYSRSSETEPIPALARLDHRRRDIGRPMPPAQPAQQRGDRTTARPARPG